jgi:transcriptional regulator with XRE-family HTH domain
MTEFKILLGKRIRALRRSKDLTQEQLGEKAGINYKYLGAIERGEKNISVESLQKISLALGVEVVDLFDAEHQEQDAKILRQRITTLLEEADVPTLQITFRLLKAFLR